MSFQQIFKNNEKWIASKLENDPDYFTKLAEGQHPQYLYIGCSDSRVTSEDLMGVQPGEVFVHRNVANLVVPTDANINAVIQYSVNVLQVKHIVVCGHYECGGVKAALEPSDMGQLNAWLQTLRDVRRLHKDEIDAIEDKKMAFDKLVELNVIEQCINLIKNSHIQRSWYKYGYPNVHGWVFDVRTGKIKDLNLNMGEVIADFRYIYDMKPAIS
jgi:carbonic anhydrase